jgi:Zn-dependent protease/predicted transcriptional regulator
MGGSWRIGRLAGIDVFVHWTFTLLLAWVLVTHYMAHRDMGEALKGVGFILGLFGIVVLHELGHALAARRYGIATRDITLLPIGGVARLDRIPEQPSQELAVALAGPAVNVVLAAALYFGLSLHERIGTFELSQAALVGGNLLAQLFGVNVMLALFNLIPAFPMDGGRVLRALLAMRMDYVTATQTAARIGQGIAVLFAIAGLFGNPFLILIALFVWFGAGQVAALAQLSTALKGIPVRQVMVTNFHTLRAEEPLVNAARYVAAGVQQDSPVVNEQGQVIGIVTRPILTQALAAESAGLPVGEVMQRDFVTVHPRDMLYAAFTKLQTCECRTLPVVDDQGRLVGLLTADNVAEVLMIREATGDARKLHVAGAGDAVEAARERLEPARDKADAEYMP